MNLKVSIVVFVALFYVVLLLAAPRATTVSAEPRAQSTTVPTEEPTRRPYVFPTPVFIPTYADDTPVPRTTPVAPLQPGVDTYTVQPGDSPWIIAQTVYGSGTKYKLIMEANGLTDQTRLRVGTVLRIPSLGGIAPPPAPTAAPSAPIRTPTPAPPLQPGPDTYTVQPGDSPWSIAQTVYGDGTKYKSIMEANGLTDETRLRVGMVLRIPSLGGTPPPPAPTAAPSAPIRAPTPAPPIVAPTMLPTAPAFPTFAPTPPASTIPSAIVDMLPTAITVASGTLFIAALAAGVLAYLMFARAQRLERLSSGKHPIRIKQ